MTSEEKVYLTQQQLIREVKDELYILGGRANTVDLARELKVDLNQINSTISKIVTGLDFQLVAESLIANYYLEEIAQEINVKLVIKGKIVVSDLSLQYDLPVDTLQHDVLEKYLGTIIIGKQDLFNPEVFYTEEYITRTKSKMRGALMGLIKPTCVTTIRDYLNLEDELFLSLFDQLNDTGVIMNRHNLYLAMYDPYCYIRSKDDWLIGFYKVNNYLEFYTLTEYEIHDHKEYVKRILPNEDMIFLKSCVIDLKHKQKLETALEECIASKKYINISSCLNLQLYDEDIETFLNPLLKKYSTSIVVFDIMAFSTLFIESLKQICLPMTQKNADAVVMSGQYHRYIENQLAMSKEQCTPVNHKSEKYEEFRKKTSSSEEGIGTLGKENKTNPVIQDSDTNKIKPRDFRIINIKDVENIIKDILEKEDLHTFVTPIAEYLQGLLVHTHRIKLISEIEN